MAGRADIKAGGAFVELSLKDSMSKELTKKIHEVGKTMVEFGHAIHRIGAVLKEIGLAVTAPFVGLVLASKDMREQLENVHQIIEAGVRPAIEPIVTYMEQIAAGAGVWAAHNQKAVAEFLKIGGEIAAVGIGFELIAKVIKAADASMKSIKSAMSVLGITSVTVAAAWVAAAAAIYAAWYSFTHWTSEGQELTWKWHEAEEAVKQKAQQVAEKLRLAGAAALEAKENAKAMEEAVKATAEESAKMAKSIESAWGKRQSLVTEFMTDAERFIAKEKQLYDAIAELNRNRVLNFVSETDAAKQRLQLEEAIRRNRQREAERLARLNPKPPEQKVKEEKVKERMKSMFALTDSSFSVNGALALANGAGGGGVQAKTYTEIQKMHRTMYKAMKATEWLAQNAKHEAYQAKMGR